MGEGNKALLNKMLDQIQSLAISNEQTVMYTQILEKSGEARIFSPPTTDLVTTIKDLSNTLANDFYSRWSCWISSKGKSEQYSSR